MEESVVLVSLCCFFAHICSRSSLLLSTIWVPRQTEATPDRVLLFLLSLSGVEVYPPSWGKSGHKLPKATPERVLLSCLKRQIDALCTKRLLVIIIAGICTIIMAKYRSKKVHRLPSAAFCRMRSLGVERKCWFSTNCPCICCLFVVFLIASKRFVVCIWGIACR